MHRRSALLLVLCSLLIASFACASPLGGEDPSATLVPIESPQDPATEDPPTEAVEVTEAPTEEPATEEPGEATETESPAEDWATFNGDTFVFDYPADWVARPATLANVPAIAISTSEDAIVVLESGTYTVESGQVVLGIYRLTDITQFGTSDIVAGAPDGGTAAQIYADGLQSSGYEAHGPDSIELGGKTISRSGATFLEVDQLLYGWNQNVVYVTSQAEEIGSFQENVEQIIATINNLDE